MKRLLIVALLMVSACSQGAGIVVRKEFQPAHIQKDMAAGMVLANSLGYPEYAQALAPNVEIPDKWYIVVDRNGDRTPVEVTREQFSRIDVGDRYESD